MEKKTYWEILLEVKDEELRHKILHNTLEGNSVEDCYNLLKRKFSGLSNLINSSFHWDETKEGHKFWRDISDHKSKKISIFDLLKEVKDSKLQYEILENIISQRSSYFDKLYFTDVPTMILESFDWSESKQGSPYWEKVHKSFIYLKDGKSVTMNSEESLKYILEIISKF